MKIKETDKLIGKNLVIVEECENKFCFIPEYYSLSEKPCGVYWSITNDLYSLYSFEHDNKKYLVALDMSVNEQIDFEDMLIKMYNEYGNWYDAFKATLL